MDAVFSKQKGHNLEVYINDMIVKTSHGEIHALDLEDILGLVRNYNMRLNPASFSFGVQARNFLGFMHTKIGK